MTIQRIKLRRGTAAAWTSANPTLAAGEPGYETDTGKHKIGNGATAWASLAYVVPTAAALAADSAFTSQFAPKANPTFTGNVVVPTPTASTHAARLVRTPNATTGDLGLPGFAGSNTGIRNIAALFSGNYTFSIAELSRAGSQVHLYLDLTWGSGTANADIILANVTGLLVGFRPRGTQSFNTMSNPAIGGISNNVGVTVIDNATIGIRVMQPTPLASGQRRIITMSWPVFDSWPTSLPGTQVTAPVSW